MVGSLQEHYSCNLRQIYSRTNDSKLVQDNTHLDINALNEHSLRLLSRGASTTTFPRNLPRNAVLGTLPSPTSPESTFEQQTQSNNSSYFDLDKSTRMSGIDGPTSIPSSPINVLSSSSRLRNYSSENTIPSTGSYHRYLNNEEEEEITHRLEVGIGHGRKATLEVRAGEEKDIEGLASRFLRRYRLPKIHLSALTNWLRHVFFQSAYQKLQKLTKWPNLMPSAATNNPLQQVH